MKTFAIATLIVSTVALTGCDLKPKEYHIGRCAAGLIYDSPGRGLMYTDLLENALRAGAVKDGLDPDKVIDGYMSWDVGSSYKESCEISKKAKLELDGKSKF